MSSFIEKYSTILNKSMNCIDCSECINDQKPRLKIALIIIIIEWILWSHSKCNLILLLRRVHDHCITLLTIFKNASSNFIFSTLTWLLALTLKETAVVFVSKHFTSTPCDIYNS